MSQLTSRRAVWIPLVFALVVSAGAQAPDRLRRAQPASEFCGALQRVLDAAGDDFTDLDGTLLSGLGDSPTLLAAHVELPMATTCFIRRSTSVDEMPEPKAIETAATYGCTWANRTKAQVREQFEQLTNAVRACVPELQREQLDPFTFQDAAERFTMPPARLSKGETISIFIDGRGSETARLRVDRTVSFYRRSR